MPWPERRREDHDAADDRRHPAPHQRPGAPGRRRRACEPDPGQDAARLHSRPAVRIRQAHRGRVPALRGSVVWPGRRRGRAARRRAARGVRADQLEGRTGRSLQSRDAQEADHLERTHPPAAVHRGGRADGGPRSQGGAVAQGHLPPVRGPWGYGAHEHPHAGGGGGDVRRRRDRPAREDRRGGNGGRLTAAAPRRRRESRGAVPEAHRRRGGARPGRGAGQRGQRGRGSGVTQPSLWRVLEPKWRTALQRVREERSRGGSGKLLLLTIVGLLFWLGVYRLLYKILTDFRGVEDLGPLVAGKLLSVALLSFITILVLSNVVTALSSFFLAKDLDLLVSAPVDWLRIYLAKLGETLLHSSWMVALMAVPIFAAYGVIYRGGLLFIPYAVLTVFPLLVLPAVAGTALTLVLVNIFPARRTRDLLSIVALGAAGGLILLFRLIRPERLASPEGFRNLLDYIAVLRTPTSPFLPSEWVTQAIMSFLRGQPDLLPVALLWTTAAAFVALGAMLHRSLFAPGFTKAQEAAERFVRGELWRRTVGTLLRFLPVAKREFVIKDIKLFFRDTTQWSQLILLAVLVLVYLFNVKTLPLHRGEAVGFFYITLVSFLNLGLAGFVLAAIAARFIFPAVSLEGRHMWLLRSSPLDLRALLWSKYWVGTVPLLVLALLLTGLTNVLLQVRPFMMVMELVTICGLTFAIGALALGFGALYPQFETENAAQIPTSFGGLVFMMATIVLLGAVIFVLWQAVSQYVRSVFLGQPVVVDAGMIAWFAVAAALCAGATAVPLWIGLRRMERFEF